MKRILYIVTLTLISISGVFANNCANNLASIIPFTLEGPDYNGHN